MTAKEWFIKVKREKFALGAFNIGNLETIKAVAWAAKTHGSPVIIESSPGETEWLGADNLVDVARNFSQDFHVPILVNLDHAQSLEECEKAIKAGYDLIHFDGSKLPLQQNIEILKQVVASAHQKGLLVEGEFNPIGGSSEVHQGIAEKQTNLTDPMEAKKFVEESGVDILAVSIGNVHGIFVAGGEDLNLDLLQKINKTLPNTYFSLHGGSGINSAQIQKAVALGIVKVNINTEIRQAFKENLTKVLAENPNEVAMYKLEKPVVQKIQELIEQKIKVFGSAGKI